MHAPPTARNSAIPVHSTYCFPNRILHTAFERRENTAVSVAILCVAVLISDVTEKMLKKVDRGGRSIEYVRSYL